MSDILDLYMEIPAMLMHVDPRKPLCNKGAEKPKPPPPPMAPYEEVSGSADTGFSKIAMSRKGLRSTILSMPGLSTAVEPNAGGGILGQAPMGLGQRNINMAAQVANPPVRGPTPGQVALSRLSNATGARTTPDQMNPASNAKLNQQMTVMNSISREGITAAMKSRSY